MCSDHALCMRQCCLVLLDNRGRDPTAPLCVLQVPLEGLDLQHVSILFTQGDLAAITPIYSYTYRVLPQQVSEAAWRQLLYMLGPPGLAIGLLVLLTLSEPRDEGPPGGLLGSMRQTAGNALQQLRARPGEVSGGPAPPVSKGDGCCQSARLSPLPGAAGPCQLSWSAMKVTALCRSGWTHTAEVLCQPLPLTMSRDGIGLLVQTCGLAPACRAEHDRRAAAACRLLCLTGFCNMPAGSSPGATEAAAGMHTLTLPC